MRKIYLGLLIAALMSLPMLGGIAVADVNVQIGLPPLVFSSPPDAVVIPGTYYVYYFPDLGQDLFFYSGFWYRPYEGRWYRSRDYNGPWVNIGLRRVPNSLLRLPPDYRRMTGYRRIPYGDLNRNWRAWERNRYWENHGWNREERERGMAPYYGGEHERRHNWDRDWDRERHHD